MTDAATLLQHLIAHFQGRYRFELFEDQAGIGAAWRLH